DAEMQMRRRVRGVAGVADEAEEIAGLNFHAFVEAGRPPVEVRVVERGARFGGQPDASSAEALLADVADDAAGNGDDFRPAPCKDVDACVEAMSFARVVP